MRPRLKPLAALVLLGLQGCSMAPGYTTPALELPAHYREQTSAGPWHSAQPNDQLAAQWWTLYHDATLDHLQQQLLQANPDLAAALAHFDAAQAYASQLHAGLFPQINASAQPLRQRQSDSRPLRGTTQPSVYNSNTAGFSLSYDLDLWGRIRNQVAAGDAQAQASADDLAVARLSLQRQLATLYVQLNGLDAQARILNSSLEDFSQALQLTRSRYEGQIASELDLTRAQNQLSEARAQLDDVRGQRNLIEHALAELIGVAASDFTLAPTAQLIALPAIPLATAQPAVATSSGYRRSRAPGVCRQRQHRRGQGGVVSGFQLDRLDRRADPRRWQSALGRQSVLGVGAVGEPADP